MEGEKIALIIGAGPGGLTAGLELLTRSNIRVIILESSNEIGGISRTVNYKGNRIDIGGHRFFSKSERVLRWWSKIMPVENQSKSLSHESGDKAMLIRNRISRIFFRRTFFDYPINLNFSTIKKLGLKQVMMIGITYISIRLFPIKKEHSLEDFFINRFGKVLYKTFFKDYTEKVWGIPCKQIKPEWGAQRIKGLSISKAIKHYVFSSFKHYPNVARKKIETSLIDKFMYPKLGPGQLWEEVAERITSYGGKIEFGSTVSKIFWSSESSVEVTARDSNGKDVVFTGCYLISTMPVKDLIRSIQNEVPHRIQTLANGLMYRDFITVGLLVKHLKISDSHKLKSFSINKKTISDNWIYIQENDVKLGRLQIFNNWSPYMVANIENVWIGLEYFCNKGDTLWNMEQDNLLQFAIDELVKLGFVDEADVLDGTVIKVPKAYPAYFGTYDAFDEIRGFTDKFTNMYLVGRNGMHKYNNQDHSMLTAMVAVDNILSGKKEKKNIWEINTEQEYHETKDTV